LVGDHPANLLGAPDRRPQPVDLPQKLKHDRPRVLIPYLCETLGGEWRAVQHDDLSLYKRTVSWRVRYTVFAAIRAAREVLIHCTNVPQKQKRPRQNGACF
jgi:hypothetical protein